MGKHSQPQESSLGLATKPKKAISRRVIIKRIVVITLAVLLIAAGSAFAYVKYLEGKMKPKGLMAKAIAAVISPPAPKEPINFLVMGVDATEEDPKGRSDTLILVHVDQENKKATMVSIPRDFRVEIPDEGMDKINHSYNYGGPALTIKTVEQYTGLPIHHYVVVNYQGFTQLVNAIGGVEVDVKEDMFDDELGAPIYAGKQRLNGDQALFYVRFRNAPTGDFTRIADQQNFARALIDESARIQNAFRIPALINILSNNIETDMSIKEMLEYANAARSFKQDGLTTVMLPGYPDMIDGVSYVIPEQSKVDQILEFVRANKEIDPLLLEDVNPSDVNVKVLNGTATEGVGGEVADILGNAGYNIVLLGNADRANYKTSVIYYAKVNKAKALAVQRDLKDDIPDIKLVESSTIDGSAHVLVIVGVDYK